MASSVMLFICFILLVIITINTASTIATATVTSFLFGDSLVDCGNNHYIFTLSKADSPPYGIDFSPSGGLPTGRFTNGRTVSDLIGEALGGKSFPPPYLAPSTRGTTLFKGVNYASGSSGILDETGALFVGRVPLRKQVDYFEQSRAYMVRMAEENSTKGFLKRAVFSITTGANDILDYIQPSIPLFYKANNVSPTMLQDYMVSNLTIQLKRLHELGARKFMVVGIGPLGCIPFVRAMKLIPNGQCALEVNKLVGSYNKKLLAMLDGLNLELGSEAIFVYVNTYDIVSEIMQNYGKYGFENADEPCCGGAFPPFICFKGNDERTSSFLCKDRSKYVFWDSYHPTEATNIIVAENLIDGDETITSPISIRQLYNYTIS